MRTTDPLIPYRAVLATLPGRVSDCVTIPGGSTKKPHFLFSCFIIPSLLFTYSSKLMRSCLKSQPLYGITQGLKKENLFWIYEGLLCTVISSQLHVLLQKAQEDHVMNEQFLPNWEWSREHSGSWGWLTEQDIQEIPAPPWNNKGKTLGGDKREKCTVITSKCGTHSVGNCFLDPIK